MVGNKRRQSKFAKNLKAFNAPASEQDAYAPQTTHMTSGASLPSKESKTRKSQVSANSAPSERAYQDMEQLIKHKVDCLADF